MGAGGDWVGRSGVLSESREHDVVDGFLGETGKASGLMDVAFSRCDLRVTESVLDIAEVDGVTRQSDGCEGVAEGMRRMFLETYRIKSMSDDPAD